MDVESWLEKYAERGGRVRILRGTAQGLIGTVIEPGCTALTVVVELTWPGDTESTKFGYDADELEYLGE